MIYTIIKTKLLIYSLTANNPRPFFGRMSQPDYISSNRPPSSRSARRAPCPLGKRSMNHRILTSLEGGFEWIADLFLTPCISLFSRYPPPLLLLVLLPFCACIFLALKILPFNTYLYIYSILCVIFVFIAFAFELNSAFERRVEVIFFTV